MSAATTQDEIVAVLEDLHGEGRVEVDRFSEDPTDIHLDTPAGEIHFARPVDGSKKEGADHTRWWFFGKWIFTYSVDRTPGNRTFTVLVKERASDD